MAVPNRLCPSCNATLPTEAAFCLMCGTSVGASSAPIPTDPLRTALEEAVGTQYEIMRLLGRGGMGAVYLAKEPALDRLVAIKVLPPASRDDATRERFRREARTAARLTHPNIVPLYTFGEANDVMYFVMAFVQGESLGERMRRKGKIPPDDVRQILAEVAEALDYAHTQGVVHRDIKPDNVLIADDSGRALLTDFGVAKATSSGSTLTEPGSVVGTVHYMSPEQASGDRQIDGRSDIYSLGVIGYTMLAGRLPFEGESAQEILVQHVTKSPIPLETLASDVPDDLVGVVRRAMAKEPEDRWPDGRSVRDELALKVIETDEIPEVLFSFDGVGVWLCGPVVYMLVLIVAISELFQIPGGGLGWEVLALTGFGPLFLCATALTMRWDKRFRHISQGEFWRVCFRQPTWWIAWYPKALRRRSMMWERLPKPVRAIRTALAATFATGLIVFPAAALPVLALGSSTPLLGWLSVLIFVSSMGLAVVGSGLGAAMVWWGKKHGLEDTDIMGLLGFASPRTVWKKPAVLKLLKPEVQEEKHVGRPSSPDEFVTEISRLVKELTGPPRQLGEQSVVAARQLVSSIKSIAREIQGLSQGADPAEISRLEDRLSAFDEGRRGEADEQRQIRELTQSQLDLMRRLASRLDATKERCARMLDLLKTLWLQVASLRAETTPTTPDSDEITGKIRALCEEIERHVTATEETLSLTPPGRS